MYTSINRGGVEWKVLEMINLARVARGYDKLVNLNIDARLGDETGLDSFELVALLLQLEDEFGKDLFSGGRPERVGELLTLLGEGRKDCAIYGCGGFGREVLMLLQQVNERSERYHLVGFFDDGKTRGEIVNGYPVLGGMDELNDWRDPLSVVVAIGSPGMKKQVVDRIRNERVSFPTVIHPLVEIREAQRVSIGKGCIICGGNLITVNIEIKDFVILNLNCTVGHDTFIGDYSSLMPGVNISGEVNVGKEVYVGTGAKIINQVNIEDDVIVGAGAVVLKSLPARCTAVGIPARPVKFH